MLVAISLDFTVEDDSTALALTCKSRILLTLTYKVLSTLSEGSVDFPEVDSRSFKAWHVTCWIAVRVCMADIVKARLSAIMINRPATVLVVFEMSRMLSLMTR